MRSNVSAAAFVKERLQLNAPNKRPFSIRRLSQQLGYRSDRAIGMVMNGRRAMSADMVARFSAYFRLSPQERGLLHLLARQDQLRNKGKFSAELEREINQNLKAIKSDYRILTDSEIHIVQNWFSFPLIELVERIGPLSIDQIEACFLGRVPRIEIKRSLGHLLKAGFITEEKGRFQYRLGDTFLTTSKDVPSQAVREGHKQQLKRAQIAIDEQAPDRRLFANKSFAIPRKSIPIIKRRLRDLLEGIVDEFITQNPDAQLDIYQLNIQFFQQATDLPLTGSRKVGPVLPRGKGKGEQDLP